MKPLNSKEQSKQFWQFLFIFFALCMIPVSLIFFSYYKAPQALNEDEMGKLANYSAFEHTQKLLVKQLAEINEDMTRLSTNPPDGLVLKEKIAKKIATLSTSDSGRLMTEITKGYDKQLTNVLAAIDLSAQNKKLNQDLQTAKSDADKLKSDMILNNTSQMRTQN